MHFFYCFIAQQSSFSKSHTNKRIMFRKMIKSLLYMHGFGDINNSEKSVP